MLRRPVVVTLMVVVGSLSLIIIVYKRIELSTLYSELKIDIHKGIPFTNRK